MPGGVRFTSRVATLTIFAAQPGALRGLRFAERLQDGLEKDEAIGAAEARVAGALRMGHEAKDVARAVADAGDVLGGAVGVGVVGRVAELIAVAEHDLAVAIELGKG